MNISLPLGFGLSSLIVFLTIHGEIKNAGVFLNVHAIMMVIGGTFAATLICFPLGQLLTMFKLFIKSFTGQGRHTIVETVKEIVKISEKSGQDNDFGDLASIKSTFLKEAMMLMKEGGLTDIELEEVLEKRVDLQNDKYKRDASTFKIIGKFPPAFGLVGASLGMIGLLQGLGAPDAFEKLGPSMSVALVATFFGLVVANFFLIPLSENLAQATEEDLIMRRVVVDGVRLLKEEKHPLLVAEFLKSYLTDVERLSITVSPGSA